MINPPEQPENSFRLKLTLTNSHRMDTVLLEALRAQDENISLKNISRNAFKELFKTKSILIKGQSARPSSMMAKGVTYVDILGFSQTS